MPRGITLTRDEEALAPLPNRGDAFRIRITASNADMMAAEVFLMRRNTRNARTGTTVDEFCKIASPDDLVNFPTDDPEVGASPPYFRVAVIDVLVSSRQIALELWEEVHARVCELVDALNRKDQLVEVETERCGAPEEPGSVSMSESMSITI